MLSRAHLRFLITAANTQRPGIEFLIVIIPERDSLERVFPLIAQEVYVVQSRHRSPVSLHRLQVPIKPPKPSTFPTLNIDLRDTHMHVPSPHIIKPRMECLDTSIN